MLLFFRNEDLACFLGVARPVRWCVILMRVALYWAPAVSDPFWVAGCAWLGRDAASGEAVPQPNIAGISGLTADARGYGFHCTLRAPMRLAGEWTAFRAGVAAMVQRTGRFPLPQLEVRDFGGFLALGLAEESPALRALADECVRVTEPHRRALAPAERTRRRAAKLSARQDALLVRYGYPYVMEEWFFHLTLSRRLKPVESATLRPFAARHFEEALQVPRMVEEICIFTQEEGAPFTIAERFRLR